MTRHSKINLIDLAGSERVNRSEVAGDRLKEAQAINNSLSCLGDVIYSLGAKSGHVPFRNSKLSRILKPSLIGAGCTVIARERVDAISGPPLEELDVGDG